MCYFDFEVIYIGCCEAEKHGEMVHLVEITLTLVELRNNCFLNSWAPPNLE